MLYPEGMITVTLTIENEEQSRTLPVNLAVVKTTSSYNKILGRLTINALRAICSTYHLSMKFPTSNGVADIRSDLMIARECYLTTLRHAGGSSERLFSHQQQSSVLAVDVLDPPESYFSS